MSGLSPTPSDTLFTPAYWLTLAVAGAAAFGLSTLTADWMPAAVYALEVL